MEFRKLDPRRKSPFYEQQDVSERLDTLQGTVAILRQRQEHQAGQWRAVCEEQRQHCADLASIYQQLQDLLLAGGDGEARQRSGSSAGGPPQESLRGEVCELLRNFKDHIEQHTTETNQRLDNMQRSLEEMEVRAENDNRCVARQEERLTRLEEQQREMLRRLSSASTRDDLERLRATVSQQLHSQREDAAASTQRYLGNVDAQLTAQEAHYREEHRCLQRETQQSIEQAMQRLQGQLDSFSGELQTQASDIEVRASNMEERTRGEVREMLTAHVAKTCEQVEEVHRELTGKHQRLVEDTMNALGKMANLAEELPRKVFLLQEDVANIHGALDRHGEALNEQCLQGSLQGAFDEVKDWLQDLERRALGRGEFDESMAGIDDKLAALKKEFILRSLAERTTEHGINVEGDGSLSTAAGGGGGDAAD
ncbi:uncharacterized protein Tco025E_05358 [Trypanosoma conorhini]|uniref:Uncharacterized protein n=1 Tax=Trypanosoma conorhini TaxID=83891 RepID=A0A3R7RYK1_9TRYP|nr:uncharacterized protein Tco025E_05358 [Trypanosoma conorhini]RNF15856.1 hypothetical protein Tco025E_05358 [Trypanosoma conorhini]